MIIHYLYPSNRNKYKYKRIYTTGVKFCCLAALEYWHKMSV